MRWVCPLAMPAGGAAADPHAMLIQARSVGAAMVGKDRSSQVQAPSTKRAGEVTMLTILLIIIVLLLLFGGFGYSRRGRRL